MRPLDRLLHDEGWYDDADVPTGLVLPALAVPVLAVGTRLPS